MTGPTASALDNALEGQLNRFTLRAGSLAITLFGDFISVQGGSVWLGALVETMGQLGLNSRQSRTALFRLSQDGWLQSELRGRRSYYSLSDYGHRHYSRAAARIYAAEPPIWDGQWTLLMETGVPPGERDELRKRLGWIGFGQLTAGVLAHPRCELELLEETLAELGLTQKTVVWRGQPYAQESLSEVVHSAWQLDKLAAGFDDFQAAFEPIAGLIANHHPIEPKSAFILRTLLIHEYRRILLKCTDLPPELLPHEWAGHHAMELVCHLYRECHLPALDYVLGNLSNEHGSLPPPDENYYLRFGGLDGRAVHNRRQAG